MATTVEMKAEKVREEAFHQTEVKELTTLVKSLQYDCANLTQSNSELSERVKKLASRQPAWPKGYRPPKRHNSSRPN